MINGVEIHKSWVAPAEYVDKYSGPCIVIGHAPGWKAEYFDAREAIGDVDTIMVNEHLYTGIRSTHRGTVHPEVFTGPQTKTILHTDRPPSQCADKFVSWPILRTGEGSSSLFCALIALCMGYAPVVLAGVHLSEVVRWEQDGRKCFDNYKSYQVGWKSRFDQVVGRVFSMAPDGVFTKDFLGGPEEYHG